MFGKQIIFAILFWIVSGIGAFAQLRVNFPEQRAIFQRDNANNGKIHLHGFVPPNTNRVEVRLLPLNNGQGTATDWMTIDTDPVGGSFTGSIEGKGGWYVLQVRSFENSIQNGSTQVDRVGIGEVFIISGQSNAQGLDKETIFNPRDASDDRVNAYTHNKIDFINELPPLGEFSQLKRTINIGPHGQTSWAWGELGDRLVRDLNVPVMFFNAAYEGTTIENWRKSVKGEPTILEAFNVDLPNQTPYSFLRIILQNHASVYGLRTILWMHGESDNFSNTTEEQYYQDLKLLVEKTRSDTGKAINWMISRTSLLNNTSYTPVINAQNRIINDLPNVFAGPQTDLIQNPRFDGVHLSNQNIGTQGLTDLANAFRNSLNNVFFQNSNPILAKSILKPVVACNTANFVQLSIPGTFKSILWNKEGTLPTVIDNSGVYQAVTRDSFGNYTYSALVDISKVYPSVVPQILSVGKEAACVGEELKYTTDRGDFQTIWQDGSISRNFTSKVKENVFAVYQNNIGCKSNQSNFVVSNFIEKPSVPIITSTSGVVGACEGESIRLQVINAEGKKIVWSNGQEGENVAISTLGKSSIFAYAVNPLGCSSEPSDPFAVEIVETPEAPMIFQSGPYTLGITKLENHKKYEWFDEKSLLETTQNDQFQVTKDGFYRVKSFNEYSELGITCGSYISGLFSFVRNPNLSGLLVYPNPVRGNEFFLASDRLIKNANFILIDELGRSKLNFSLSNFNLPQKVDVKGNHLLGKYILRIDYDGFYKVLPIVFE